MSAQYPTVNILNLHMTGLTQPGALSAAHHLIALRRPAAIYTPNAEMAERAARDSSFAALLNRMARECGGSPAETLPETPIPWRNEYLPGLGIFFRDRKNHKSPNSAHTEAACAGALGVQLAGSNFYFGKLVEKPTIGDPLRPVEPGDIARANRLMYATAALALVLFCLLPLSILLITQGGLPHG